MYPNNKEYPFEPEKILTKDKREIDILHDVIGFNILQRQKLKNEIKEKTLAEWQSAGNSISVRLTPEQMKDVMKTKNDILKEIPVGQILHKRIMIITDHGRKRAIERIEGKNPNTDTINPVTQFKIIKAIKESTKLVSYAEWSGFPNLSFLFRCKIDGNSFNIAVAFKESLLVVTIIKK